MFKKLTSLIVTLVMVLTIVGPMGTINAKAAEGKTFDLIEITDFHGALLDSTQKLPVAAVLANNIKNVTDANPTRTLVMGGGDLYQGTPISNVLTGVSVQKALSAMGMEVTTLGNHEFDWTLDKVMNTTMTGAKYSVVCSNVYDKATGKRVFEPYKIIEKDGVKIGIIGAITLDTINGSVLAANIAPYNVTDIAKEVNSLVSEVKAKGADVVLALIHEGSNATDTTNSTGKIFDITKQLVGVDAVFGGHSHTTVTAKATNGIPVYIGNNAGKGFIDAKMTIGADGKPSFICDATSYFATDNDKATGYKAATPVQEPAVKAVVDDAIAQVGPTFNEVIGNTTIALSRTQDVAPYGESQLGNWNADVIRTEVGADVGFQNNGGIRTDIAAGDVNVGAVYTLMPFDNEICTTNMTKAQLKVVLEQAFADGGKGVQLSGIKVTYDAARKSLDRVTEITRADGKAISDTEVLKIATNDFMMTGGDGFAGFVTAGGAVNNVAVNDTHILVRDALIKNVRANKGIVTTMDKRIVNVGKVINIVGTSDLHGSILGFDYSNMKTANFGLAKVSTYVNKLRATNPNNVMLIDNGDTIQGTPLVYYYNMIDTKTEYPMMKAMGAMKYDSWTLGNHEFNYGLDTLKRIMADAAKENIPVLSANIYNADDTNFVKPYITKTFTVNGKDIKVGILGLTTKNVPGWEDASHIAGLKFNDLVSEAKKWVPIMKADGVNVVVASIHSGLKGAADTTEENQVDAVATQVSGIDAILCGHTHSIIAQKVFKNPDGKDVIVTEPKNTDGTYSQIDINIDGNGNVGLIASKSVISDASVAEDPEIVKITQPYQDKTIEYVNTVLGTATDEFSGKDQTVKPTALMDLINIVQAQSAGTQLSIAAPLSASAYIPKGDVTIKDFMGVYVYENFLYGVKMNGKQIKDWMEASVKYYKQVTKADDPIVKDPVLNIADYNLDFLYGANYDVDLTQPAGQRIKNLMYNGKFINDTDEFTVAINNYRYNGGGGFMAAAGLKPGDPSITTYDSGKTLGDDGQVRSLMMNYTKTSKLLVPTVSNNWKLSTTAVAPATEVIDTPVVEPVDNTTVDQEQIDKDAKIAADKAIAAKKAIYKSRLKSMTVKVQLKKGLRIYAGANLKSKVVAQVKFGTVLAKEGTTGKWYKVGYNGKHGYVEKASVK